VHDAGKIRVEVVFATPADQTLVVLDLDPGATVADAIAAAGLSGSYPADLQAGIWGRPVEAGRGLADGDRVELYRPLQMDPREARRLRAAAGESMAGPNAQPSAPRDPV
jgi:putative ubiquitin-RnfH superfamily antitoxin RatB of RatAB toxin-antitoxin module